MKYIKVSMDQALMRPQLMRVLIGNGVAMNASYYLVPEDHSDLSFILLNLEAFGEYETVSMKGRQEPGILSMV